LVDKGISFRISSNGRAKLFKPDLAIIKDKTLTHYFDLKMDLGWNRDIENYLIKKNDFINNLKQVGEAWHTIPINSQAHIKISQDLVYQIVVLSKKNGNDDALQRNIELANKLENVSLYILTSGMHLNFYGPEEREKVIVKEDDFDKLISDTKAVL
jgi:hypothetical protein